MQMNSMAVLLLLESLAKFGMLAILAQVGQIADSGQNREKDFGWQISEDGVLEYIVQVTPQDAQIMMTKQLENPSDMPPELVGRATRIIFRIGTSVLPRTPSLEEIKRRFPHFNTPSDVTAALGPGRISDVEGTVLPAQNGNTGGMSLPPLPSSPTFDSFAASQGNSSVPNAIDQARRAAEQFGEQRVGELGQAANDFLNSARQPNSAGQGLNLPTATAPPTRSSSDPGGFLPPSRQPTSPPPQSLQPNTGLDRWNSENVGRAPSFPSTTDPRSLGNPYADEVPQRDNGFAPTPTMSQRDPMQMPGRSLSDSMPGSYDLGYAPDRFGSGMAPTLGSSPALTPSPLGGGRYPDPTYYGDIAQRDAPVPRGTGVTRVLPAERELEARDASLSPSGKGTSSSTGVRRNENFLVAFFLLSLVVNLYLGVLIRKLLTRYRALLTSVRSQVA
jgi:hypothetical protein